ncbi:Hypothetical predicted protein [Paramuricea clavata]|uniref:Uncharacterized protein n=1 Tax=Paramuricea clavata TaxID=317549 RepID=A0A6S7IER8_PARCT|nr:Hypothetical predicted protein [Paramuricea clavata]
MKRMRTSADSDSATSESDVENSCNTDNEVETDSASESDSDNVDDTSSKVGDEYESDPWGPLKAEAAQQSLSEFEELTQNFTAEALDLENVLAELYRLIGNSKKQSKWIKSGIKNIPIRQPKSSRKRTKSNTKSGNNVDNTEMDDGSKEWLKLEAKTE